MSYIDTISGQFTERSIKLLSVGDEIEWTTSVYNIKTGKFSKRRHAMRIMRTSPDMSKSGDDFDPARRVPASVMTLDSGSQYVCLYGLRIKLDSRASYGSGTFTVNLRLRDVTAVVHRGHGATIAKRSDGKRIVTCPHGCKLGTSALCDSDEQAQQRVEMHETATSLFGRPGRVERAA